MKRNVGVLACFGLVVLDLLMGCTATHAVGEYPEVGGTAAIGVTSNGGVTAAGGQGGSATAAVTQGQTTQAGANSNPAQNTIAGQNGTNLATEPPPPVLPNFGSECVLTRYGWDPTLGDYKYLYIRVSYDEATRTVKREQYEPSTAAYSLLQLIQYDQSGNVVYYEDHWYGQTTSHCSYDARGNLVAWDSVPTVAEQDPIVSSGTVDHTYDASGALISSTLHPTDLPDEVYTFSTDSQNHCIKIAKDNAVVNRRFSNDQLIRVESANDSGPTCHDVDVMQYDALGRLIVMNHFNGNTPNELCDDVTNGSPVPKMSYEYSPDGTVDLDIVYYSFGPPLENTLVEYEGALVSAMRIGMHAPTPCAQLFAQIPQAPRAGCFFSTVESPPYLAPWGVGDCAPTP